MDNQIAHLKLHLHAQTGIAPSLEQCWMEGYFMSSHGQEDLSCPYLKGSKEHQFYEEGWFSGYYGEDPLFPEHAVSLSDDKPIETATLVDKVISHKGSDKLLYALGLGVATVGLLTTVVMDMAA